MIDLFYEWFEGKFTNRIQAFSYPSKYAYIVVEHRRVNNHGLFYGEQAYFNKTRTPYRQFVLQISERRGKIVVRNMEPQDKTLFLGFNNLNRMQGSPLTYKRGCDTIFEWKPQENQFVGVIEPGCDCLVKWGNRDTYLQNTAYLGETFYHVEDKGFDVSTNEHVWGSKYGHFQFRKGL